ncbi:MAG TPA: EboA domain-containing protein [Polyangiaceae bacterium]|nr:EboA domain-containing protein [Polyangiaceae bacterium]
MSASTLIDRWLSERVASDRQSWLGALLAQVAAGNSAAVALGFSQLPRRFVSGPLILDRAEIAEASAARPGWQPSLWTLDELGRARVVVELGALPEAQCTAVLLGLFADADLAEQIALYKALAIAPYPKALVGQAAEGIRNNIKSVFEAVALDNPYPAEFFSEAQFNQLLLKCLFVESPLVRVWGIDGRVNLNLARMLCDYAKERWAASRPVSPELWRCVGPVATAEMLPLLQRVVNEGQPREKLAAVRSLLDNELAIPLLQQHDALVRRASAAGLSWTEILAWEGPV